MFIYRAENEAAQDVVYNFTVFRNHNQYETFATATNNDVMLHKHGHVPSTWMTAVARHINIL